MAHRLTYHMRTHTDKADRQTKHTDKQNTQPEHTHIYIYDTHTDHTHTAHMQNWHAKSTGGQYRQIRFTEKTQGK